jgi:hypothetical protein
VKDLYFFTFLNPGGLTPFFVVFKEQLIGFINALTDILYRLRAYQLPKGITFPQLGNMFLKSRTVQVFVPHPVVPSMQSNATVINNSSSIDSLIEIAIALVTV